MADTRRSVYLFGSTTTTKTLTSTYDENSDSQIIPVGSAYQVALDIAYTMGSAETSNSLQLIVEFADPVPTKSKEANDLVAADWYREVALSTSGGTTTVSLNEYTFAATQSAGTYDRFHLSMPVDAAFMRVSVKETGAASNGGLVTVIATLSEDHD